MLDRLKGILRTDAFSPTAAVFPSIDATLMASRLGLEQAGRERGKAELPVQASDALDSIEMKVVSGIEEHRRAGIENYETHCKVYGERLARASEARQEVDIVAGMARTDFQSAVTVWKNGLANAIADVAAANQGLTEFQNRHSLRRPARERGNLFMWLGVVAVMIVFESALNGLLFAERNSFGLIGGAGFALLIALVNVGTSSAFGFFARYKNNRFWPVKLFGFVLIAIWIALATTFNLAVAHFRDAVVAIDGWEEAGRAALASMVASPAGVTSLTSWLLVGLGALISFIAFMKAYGLDDPYPGYGHADRTLRAARDGYAQASERAITTLIGQRDEAIKELRDAQGLVATNIGGSVDALFGQAALRSHLKTFLEQCDIKVNELLALYRDANSEVRKTPAPAHFGVSYTFPPFEAPKTDAPRKADAEKQRRMVGELVETAIRAIFAEFEQSLHSHETIVGIQTTRPFGTEAGTDTAGRSPAGKPEPRAAAAGGPRPVVDPLLSSRPRGSKTVLAAVPETPDGS